eukprot:8914726-Alexandrium_andersonii.AAC.1
MPSRCSNGRSSPARARAGAANRAALTRYRLAVVLRVRARPARASRGSAGSAASSGAGPPSLPAETVGAEA